MVKTFIMTWIAVLGFSFLFTESLSAQDYVVGEGDVLKITVYENDDLTTVARVSARGTIKMPLIGSVEISGLTVSEIVKKIAGLYDDGYLVDPQVNLFIEEYQGTKATILGQVGKPGLYDLRERTSLLELISKAGGLKKDAGEDVLVKRNESDAGKDEDVIRVNITDLVEKGDISQNITIRNGDTIYISKRELEYVYVTGEVKKPDSYEFKDDMTVIRAITKAGGLSDRAEPKKLKIIRRIDGKKKVLERVKMDTVVKPGDVIVVPESFF